MGMRTVDFKGREATDLRETFGDLPIVEATARMIVYVASYDVENGVRGDPANCMFSAACKRAFGSQAVLFYPTVAYVDTLDEDGNRIVMRFRVKNKTRQAIERFDDPTRTGPREATFLLYPIGPSATLAEKAKRQRARQQAIRDGSRVVTPEASERAKRGAAKRKNEALMGMRRGGPTHPGTTRGL